MAVPQQAAQLKVSPTQLPGVLVLTPPTIFQDMRGSYVELYNEQLYREAGICVPFVQDDISISRRHVLRGIHGDQYTCKLISCLSGKIFLVIVNCDRNTSYFGRWESFELSELNHQQVFVPPKHGVAHLVLSDRAIFYYKQSTYYDRNSQFTYRWDDSRFNITWPVDHPILSERDQGDS